MNRVHVQLALFKKKGGELIRSKEFYIVEDKFQAIARGGPNAQGRISVTYQRQIKYAEEKVVVTLNCACDQYEATFETAGELLFRKALEITDGCYGILAADAASHPAG